MNRAPPKVPFKEQYKAQPKTQPKPQVKRGILPKAISSKVVPKPQVKRGTLPKATPKKRTPKNNTNKQKVAVWTGGPAMWNELHLRALNWDYSKNKDDMQFLRGFGHRLPKFESGCKCKSFYNKYLKSTPPNFAKYFEWTVNLHNAVNKKLGKPIISLETARGVWTTK